VTHLNQRQYAERHGVAQPTVWAWVKKGWLVMAPDGKLIDAEQSDAKLAQYRDPNDPRSFRGSRTTSKRTTPLAPEVHPVLAGLFQPSVTGQALAALAATPPEPEPPSPADIALLESGSATTEEARRIKENFLALQAKQKFDEEEGSKVLLDVARGALFECAQATRNAWMSWPTDVGPLIAADLGIEVDKVVPVLTKYVHQHLSELGEPDGEFGRR